METNILARRQSTFEEYQNMPLRSTSGESVGAAFDLAWDETAVGLWSRYKALDDLQKLGGAELTPEEANKRFPGMSVPFRKPVSAVVGQYLYDREQEKRNLHQKIVNGPDDAWTQTKMLGAGLLAHLMDPLEVGASQISGWAVGGLAARGALGSTVANAVKASKIAPSFKARTILNVAEAGSGNLVENTVQEGFIANQAIDENGEYDISRALGSIAISTFAGTLLGVGIKEGAFRLATLNRHLRSTSPEADLTVARTVIGQADQDIRPNAAPIMESLARETDVKPDAFSGKWSYSYEPYTGGKKEFFIASKTGGVDGPHSDVGDRFFDGVQVTDNSGVANAAAVRGMADAHSMVARVEIGGLKLLDLDIPLTSDLHPVFERIFKKIGEELPQDTRFSARDALQIVQMAHDEGMLSDADLRGVKAIMQALGYQGTVHNGSKRVGVDHGKHNVVEVFDPSFLKLRGFHEPDPFIRVDPEVDAVTSAREYSRDPINNMFVDDEAVTRIQSELDADVEAKVELAEMQREAEGILEELQGLKDQGLLDEAAARDLETIREMKANVEYYHTLAKAAKFCVGA